MGDASSKLRRFDDDDIVKWGIDVPVVGIVRGRGETRELRDAALALGATLSFPRRSKTSASPESVPSGAEAARTRRDDLPPPAVGEKRAAPPADGVA